MKGQDCCPAATTPTDFYRILVKSRDYKICVMKNSKSFLFSFAVMLGCLFLKPADPLEIGAPLPSPQIKMKDISGKEFSFSDVIGNNGLLVMFSCNTCPVVAKYESRTVEIARYALDKKFGVILLNSNEATRDNGDSFEDMQSYGSEKGYKFPYVIDTDSKMADAFGASRTPEVFLFDQKGILIYRGAIDDNANSPDQVSRRHLQIAIDEQLEKGQISTRSTRSVGCSIKRN